jgi:anaerobic selenocysteine-containing dehydrogenase
VMWLLAEKLKAKGFPNLFDYYSQEFKDPETGKLPTTAMEFSEIAAKITSATLWMAKEPLKGRCTHQGLGRVQGQGHVQRPEIHAQKRLGRQVRTATKKFEFYSETLKKGLLEHAKKYETTTDDIMTVSGYTARGDLAFVPHYEPPKRHGSVGRLPVHLHRLQVAPEPRRPLANVTWYQEFKKVDPGDVSWGDVVKMNPADGAKLGLKTGDNVKITSTTGTITVSSSCGRACVPARWPSVTARATGPMAGWRPKTLPRPFPLGGNNNEILVDDYDRLSGATARNGGFTGVRIQKA